MKLRTTGMSAIAAIMIASMVTPVQASVYKDVSNHWAKASIEKLTNYGAISGFEGKFRPNDHITRGEMAVVLANLMQYQEKGKDKFTDLKKKEFYNDAVMKLNGAGVMKGSDNLVRPKDKVTRQEAMVMLANAFGITPRGNTAYGFNDADKIAAWATGAVGALKSSGFVSGDDKGNVNPTAPITRGELVAIVDRMTGSYANKGGAKSINTGSNVIVTTDGVEFISSRIGGNVIITDNNKGTTILADTAVVGKVITTKGMKDLKIRGNSVVGELDTKGDTSLTVDISSTALVQKLNMNKLKTLNLSGTAQNIEVNEVSGSSLNIENSEAKVLNVTVPKTKISVKGYSDIQDILLGREADECTINVAKEAAVRKISVDGEDTKLTLNGDIGKVYIKENAENAQLSISTGDNKIDEITIEAEDAKVTGSGTVKKIYVKANGANISVKDAVVYVDKGVENVTVGGEKVKGGSTINSSYTEDDTDWNDIYIDKIKINTEKSITVTLDSDNDDIEAKLTKSNFEVTSNDYGEDDPEISGVSVKNDSDEPENTVYQITFKEELEEKTNYKVEIELPNGKTISKTFKTPSDFDDLEDEEEEEEDNTKYPTLKNVELTRISDTSYEVEVKASKKGTIWIYAQESKVKDDPSISEVKNNGKKLSLKKGENTFTLKDIEAGKDYKVYMVTQDEKTSSVYGEYYLLAKSTVNSTSIKDFKFKNDDGTYFELELTDKVTGGITSSNTKIEGPGDVGTLRISNIISLTGTKYKLVTTSKLKDGTYQIKITFPDGTVRTDSVVIDVPEEKNINAPKLSNISAERYDERTVCIEFKADNDGKCYMMDGKPDAETLIHNADAKNVGQNNMFMYQLGSSSVNKISIITTNNEGTDRSKVYVVDVPEYKQTEPEEDKPSDTPSDTPSNNEQGNTQGGTTDNPDTNTQEPDNNEQENDSGNGGNSENSGNVTEPTQPEQNPDNNEQDNEQENNENSSATESTN